MYQIDGGIAFCARLLLGSGRGARAGFKPALTDLTDGDGLYCGPFLPGRTHLEQTASRAGRGLCADPSAVANDQRVVLAEQLGVGG